MLELEQADDRVRVRTPDLALRFDWSGDRWTHALEIERGGRPGPVARSVEGAEDLGGPGGILSPAYQQVHVERSADGVRLYLVGQAGRHHFSAVFQVRSEPGRTTIDVDAADRCRGDVTALASTYRVELTPSALVDDGSGRILWRLEEWDAGRLSFGPSDSALPAARFTVAEAGRVGMVVQAQAGLIAGGATQRWAYRWLWDSGRV